MRKHKRRLLLWRCGIDQVFAAFPLQVALFRNRFQFFKPFRGIRKQLRQNAINCAARRLVPDAVGICCIPVAPNTWLTSAC